MLVNQIDQQVSNLKRTGLFIILLCLALMLVLGGCTEDKDNPASPQNNVVNEPPAVPSLLSPANNETNVSIYSSLLWTCSDPEGDSLTYDVYFGTTTTPTWRSYRQTDTSYTHIAIATNKNYYWKIVSFDNHGNSTESAIWTFTTSSIIEGMSLIPAGSYLMGAEYQAPYSLPIHEVSLQEFYLDIYEVTNRQFQEFCDVTNTAYPPEPHFQGITDYFASPNYRDYPVANVDWDEACTYCAWIGKRLPTEAEWERAAKGDQDNRRWPWGDSWIAGNSNVSQQSDTFRYTSPAGTFPNDISPAGCYDMAGNLAEWCADDRHFNYTGAPEDGSAWIYDPRGPFRIVRGGSFGSYGDYENTRCARRSSVEPEARRNSIGFRCARNP